MQEHYRVLLEAMVAKPEAYVSELPMLTAAERLIVAGKRPPESLIADLTTVSGSSGSGADAGRDRGELREEQLTTGS